jgi:phytoene dehydrogenase-like protein
VIGSGPNGLAGAVTLARAGLDVVVHEAEPTVGGGTRTAELTLPGFLHDVCSSVHPMGGSSPVFRVLDPPVEWVHPGAPAAHPFDDGPPVVLERSVEETVAGLGVDGTAYRALAGPLVAAWQEVEPVLLGPHPPPPGAVAALVRALGPVGAQRAARTALRPARDVAEDLFSTGRARGFFAGHSAHSMLPLERRPSAGFGLSLCVLGNALGWPFARGGSQRIADGLVRELERLGGEVRAESPVDELPRADVVLADVVPRELVRIARGRLPERYERQLRSYRHGPGAFKLDWALHEPIPWRDADCRRAGTVHLGSTLDEISASEWRAWVGRPPERPFVLLAQPSVFDDSRAPDGGQTAWAYCHVPNGWDGDATDAIEAQVERFAPGFRDVVAGRSVLAPGDFERHDRNLVGGDVNGGAMDLGQLLTRPVKRLVPYRTPLEGVYLCSSSTPPGGGVHGMCGYGAARMALRDLARR